MKVGNTPGFHQDEVDTGHFPGHSRRSALDQNRTFAVADTRRAEGQTITLAIFGIASAQSRLTATLRPRSGASGLDRPSANPTSAPT